jgi:hypothetical protein
MFHVQAEAREEKGGQKVTPYIHTISELCKVLQTQRALNAPDYAIASEIVYVMRKLGWERKEQGKEAKGVR